MLYFDRQIQAFVAFVMLGCSKGTCKHRIGNDEANPEQGLKKNNKKKKAKGNK